jgi:abortive infection bacteriophage resistance protein
LTATPNLTIVSLTVPATPHLVTAREPRKRGGPRQVFFLLKKMLGDHRVPFTKPAKSAEDLVTLLSQRGLVVPDPKKARFYLEYIGYYRLGAYFRTFQIKDDPTHTFNPGTTFDEVLNLYIFDRELRLLVMDAIERIEVSVRCVISNAMCMENGPHWYTDAVHFVPYFDHADFLESIRAGTGFRAMSNSPRRTPFLNHYYRKYSTPELPPSWMVIEVMSIGTWSKVFSSLARADDQKRISRRFSIVPGVFESWLHSLTYLRNVCAHHQLLWCRTFIIHPSTLEIRGAYLRVTNTFYAQAVLIQRLLEIISPNSGWASRLLALFRRNAQVDITAMGFPRDWEKDRFWNIAEELSGDWSI